MIFYVFGGAEQEFLGPNLWEMWEISVEGVFSKMAAKIQLVDVLWLIETIFLVETW